MAVETVANRFAVRRCLHQGRSKSVLLVDDIRGGSRPVILKVLNDKSEDSRSLWRFHNEFRLLSDLSHPGLCRAFDLLHAPDGEEVYLLEEAAQGIPLSNLEGPPDPELLTDVVVMTARVLSYIHARGIVHFDVKPENLVVQPAPDGRSLLDLKLIDFDLAGAAGTGSRPARGTVSFVAPEVLAGSPSIDGRADLFSLGVTLLSMLTGEERPFPDGLPSGLSVQEIVPSEVLSLYGNWVPDLISSLLESEPRRRMASARAILELVRRGTESDVPDELPETLLAGVLRPRFVGRLEELARLRDSIPDSNRPRIPGSNAGAPFVLVSGERGVGKTRLVEQYTVALKTARVKVYSVSPERSHALKTLGPIHRFYRDILADRRLTSDGGPDSTTRGGEDLRGPERFGYYDDVTGAVLELGRTVPVCLQFDDVHLLDEASQEFLSYFVRRLSVEVNESPVAPAVQLVMTSTRDRSKAAQFVGLITDLKDEGLILEVPLEPLDRVVATEMVRDMVSPDDIRAAAADWLYDRTHGNPFFLRETVASLLTEDDRAMSVKEALAPAHLREAPIATRVRGVVQGRVGRARPGDMTVLQAVALHPSRISAGTLGHIEGIDSASLERSVGRLEQRGLLTRSQDDSIDFVDADTRGVVVEMMSDSRRRELHSDISSSLDGVDLDDDAWTLAYHRLEGDTPEAGFEGAHSWWNQLVAAGRYNEATTLLRRVLDNTAQGPKHLRYMAGITLSNVLVLQGESQAAQNTAEEVASEVPTPGPMHALVTARALLARGQFKKIHSVLKNAAGAIEGVDPRTAADLHLFRARSCLRQGLLKDAGTALGEVEELLSRFGSVPSINVADKTPLTEVPTPPLPAATGHDDSLSTLVRLRADLCFKKRALPEALALALLSLKMEARSGRLAELGHALHVVGNIFMTGGQADKAEIHFNKAIQLQSDVGDLAALADTLNNLGLLQKNRGHTVEAIEFIRRSLQIRREIGNREGEVQCYLNIASTLLTRRELEAADRYLKICLKLKRRLADDNNPSNVYNNLGVVAQLRDRLAAAARYYQDARIADSSFGNDVGAIRDQINLAGVHARAGQLDQALQLVDDALRQARRTEHMQVEVAYGLRVLADIRRERREWRVASEALSEALDIFTSHDDQDARTETLVDMLELNVAKGDHDGAGQVYRSLEPLDPAALGNELSVRLTVLELVFLGWKTADDVPKEVVDRVITSLKTATQRKMPGLIFHAASSLARHFERQGDEDRSFYYYSIALEALETTIRAIDDPGMMSAFMKTTAVVGFTESAGAFVDHFCPGMSDEDSDLPADALNIFEGMKKGFFEVERARGSTLAHLRRNEEGIRRILDASQTLSSTAPMDQLLVQVVDGVIDFTGAERGFIILLDDDGKLHIPVARTYLREPIPRPESQVTRRAIESIMKMRRPVILQNAMDEEGYRARESVINLELRSVMCAPMIQGDDIIGILYVDNRSRVGQFCDEDQELLAIFANQVSTAIENSRLVKDYVRDEKMRLMGMMAGGVAHDFNNLLAAILGRTQLLKETVEDEDIGGHLDTIEKAANDGAVVVRRLQDFTRVSKQDEFKVVNMAEIVDDVLDFTRSRWEGESFRSGRQLTVQNDVDTDVHVRADPAELREVFTNILLNALDAMPDGGSIRFESRLSKDVVKLIVRDSGQGMSREVRDNVFDPFFTTKSKDGRGLGMSIVYGILMRHGGAVKVESELGAGTSVIVELPLSKDVPEEQQERVPRGDFSAEGHSVLVVDDEDGVRGLLRDIVARAGYSVTEAASGPEALKLFSEGDFDLVLTDLGMVPMSGWDLAHACKEIHPQVPVVLVTGWAGEIDSKEAKSRNVDSVVSKPFDMKQLLLSIEEAILAATQN